MIKLMYTLGLLLAVFLGIFYNGYVITVMWDWFVVDALSIKSLSIPEALGFSLIASFITRKPPTLKSMENNKTIEESIKDALFTGFAYPSIILFFGWIYHYFI